MDKVTGNLSTITTLTGSISGMSTISGKLSNSNTLNGSLSVLSQETVAEPYYEVSNSSGTTIYIGD